MTATAERLFQGADWDFLTLQRIHDACEGIARTELGLDVFDGRANEPPCETTSRRARDL